ncbi:hypothetical protein [Methylobacterium nodulans]|uniref:Uncharacterized protein n=1 Tax=Methylobacterium nodulans (strain LMG 21967 / CNCM I-2342 / ORS 2060) TaxID=460265 RepID=B8IHW5_METNO|nr:hypothetical protein [Methylobacterium nodulans]ACL56003.1 conserved hypothetical protein [Methylobacterium nodulans ORS 2060]
MVDAIWSPLPREWRDAADTAAHNLGFGRDLAGLPAEHWQRVLANVEARMRMKGIEMPEGWRERLARQVGREKP